VTAPALAAPAVLPRRWEPLRPHATQSAFYHSQHRLNVVPAGRRSGKTEIAKRRLVRRAVRGSDHDRPRYFYAAPTRDQAKRIAWADLKRMVPKDAMRGRPSETDLVIPLWHGGELAVVGLDKPERMEGAPWDHGVLDEYGNMKPKAWGENIRPALSDRDGSCDLIGVPEGRNHYYDRALEAQAQLAALGSASEWGYFTWKSADILPAAEIESARRDLDELTFAQEYEASFVNFEGRAYYAFSDANKIAVRPLYDPRQPLVICLDFNVAPGVAAVAQEMALRVGGMLKVGAQVTAVIGEVWIENNSNTPAVCRRLLTDWGRHEGRVEVYGDATGGARGTAQVEGSDWDLARKVLRDGDPSQGIKGFGPRVQFHVKPANPAERARVNAVNSRTRTAAGELRLLVDPAAAPHVVRDLEGVRTLKGGSGEIDKKADPKLTHISDALGYYLDFRFPVAPAPAVGFGTYQT
jgi:hypothetical protein